MQDYVAAFYGGYDQIAGARLSRLNIPWMALALAVAAVVLVVLVAADVSALEDRPPIVQVTSISWYAEGYVLVAGAGFTIHGSSSFQIPLQCSGFCLPWNGATVNSPFQLLNFSVQYHSVRSTNVTIRAPSSSYDGPLSITLELP